MPTLRSIAIAALAALLAFSPAAPAEPTPDDSPLTGPVFRVRIDPSLQLPPRSGRIVVYFISNASSISERTPPAMAPFYTDPQPVAGVDVTALRPGEVVSIDARTLAAPSSLADLPPGEYRAQAVFDWQRESGAWAREPGNLFTGQATFTMVDTTSPIVVPLTLTNTVPAPPEPSIEGGRFFEIRSKLLSEFHDRDVYLRAGIAFPIDHQPAEQYPAIYAVPGFGGDRTAALREARRRRTLEPGTPAHTLARSTFYIVLDPDSPNGHTLFADSANNGPVGEALTTELIPALERRFRLIAEPDARLLTGHSSGGWSTLWLATEYPETFGASWSSAPDPVDFRYFQRVNIYNDQNMYLNTDNAGEPTPIPAYTRDGAVRMTIAQENAVENAIGPRNTSGQQWDSWLAVFAPRADDAHPADLYDTETGIINHAIAEKMRRYDITARLRANPERLAPIFRNNIRLVVGDADSFDLHLAVKSLQRTLNEVALATTMEIKHGYIEIVEDADHSTVRREGRALRWPQEMIDHLRRSAITVRASTPDERPERQPARP